MRPDQTYEIADYICKKGIEFHQDILDNKGKYLIERFIADFDRLKNSKNSEVSPISYSFMSKYYGLQEKVTILFSNSLILRDSSRRS